MGLREASELRRHGRLDEAERQARAAVLAAPFSAEACHLLGCIQCQRGQWDEGIGLLRRAAAFAPDVPQIRLNLGALLASNGKSDEALPHLLEARRLGGPPAPTCNDLGACLDALGRSAEAVPLLREAVRLWPIYGQTYYNLGTALRHLGRMAEAAEAYRQAVRLRPEYPKAAFGLAFAAGELGDADEAITFFRRILETRPELPGIRSAVLYTLHYCPHMDAEALYREHVEWGRLFCDPVKDQIPAHGNDRDPDRRLRVGYVSPDLREHTVPHFITAALKLHDPANFEVFCYSDVEKPDAITQKLKGMVERWRETRQLKGPDLEKLIRQDRIDILVDLRGHAADNRLTLFAHKPAPIQVNMVGYFNTTGLTTMDYRITDEHQDPPGMTEKYHTEKLARMPHSCWCYTPAEDAPEVVEPPALKNGYVTFGSLNKIVKASEPCAKLWAHVLAAVPNSRLLLPAAEADAENVAQPPSAVSGRRPESNGGFPPAGGTQPRAAMPQASPVRERLRRLGLPFDRVGVLGKTATGSKYLQRFNQIDIALDTFPFNGITTTCDGLWQGVPCVSLAGGTSVSRAGRSILRAANLAELAVDVPEAFIRAAVELATDLGRVRELRLSMRQRLLAAPLLDHVGFARDLESAYRRMWRAWCGGRR